MRFAGLPLLLTLLIYHGAFAQYPVSPNLIDENGKRTGHWTILYDSSFNEVHDADSMKFYRLMRFEAGKPLGKIRDFSKSGYKYWDGYAKSIDPYVFDGESNHYHENGKLYFRQIYVEGKREGPCAEFYANGNKKSTGQFHDDKQDGKWQYFFEDGALKVDLTFAADKKTGPAKFYFNSGQLEEQGVYKDGLMEGEWIDYYEDGVKSIVGHYKKDTLNGLREGYHHNGKLSDKGIYKKGKKHGIVTAYWDNGNVKDVGNYDNGEMNGFWKYYYQSGKLKNQGTWVDDQQTGEWEFFYENGQRSNKGKTVNAKSEGRWLTWYDDGSLYSDAIYANDSMNGPYTSYHRNHKKESEGMKAKGHAVGFWKYWNTDGILTKEGSFDDDGKETGLWKAYFESGELDTEAYFLEGVRNGTTTAYYQSGKLKSHEWYKQGYNDTLYTSYYENGNVRGTGMFKDGKKEGTWKWYFEDGKMSDLNTFVHGLEDGPVQNYYPGGVLHSDAQRRNNIIHGVAKFYYRDGNMSQQGTYDAEGKFEGKWTFYDSATRTVKELGDFKKGKRNGLTVTYTPKGKVDTKRYYINGWEETTENISDSIYHLIRIKDFDNALKSIKWMQSVEKRDYKDPKDKLTSIKMLARIYGGMKDYQKNYEADLKYLKALEKYKLTETSNYKPAIHNVATALHNMNKYDEAMKYYDQAIEVARPSGLTSTYWSTVINKIYCVYDAGKHDEALAMLNEELTNSEKQYGPDSSAGWYLRYEAAYYIYDRPSDYQKAATMLEELLADIDAAKAYDNEYWFDANYRLGNIYYNQLNREKDVTKPYVAAMEYAERNQRTDTPNYGDIITDLFYISNNHNVRDTTAQKLNKLVTDRIARSVNGFADALTRAECYLALGNDDYNKSNYPVAFELFKKAEENFIAAGKANSGRHASVLQSLAFSRYYMKGNHFAEAESYFLRSIEMKKKLYERTSVTYYTSLRQLSEFYSMNEKYDKALELVKEARKIAAEVKDETVVARCNQEIGEINYDRWSYDEALKGYLDAIAFYEKSPDEFSDSYVVTVGNVALCYKFKDDYETALTWARRSIALAEKYYGKKSSYYYHRLSTVAGIYDRAERYTEAFTWYKDAAAGFTETYGADNYYALDNQVAMVEMRNRMLEYKKAIETGEPLRVQIKNIHTEASGLYLRLSPLLATAYENLSQLPKSEEHYVSAVNASSALNGAEAPTTAMHLQRLGRFYDRHNRYDEAQEKLTQAVTIMRASDYANGPAVVPYLGYLATVLMEQEKNKEAEELFDDAVRIAKLDSMNHITTYVDASQELSRFYSKVGRFREAEALILRFSKLIENTSGKHYYYAQARQDLVYMYYRLGRYDEAKVEAADLLAILEEVAGQDHWLVLRLHNYLGIIYDDLSEFEEAKKEFQLCLDGQKRKKSPTDLDQQSLATFHSNLARVDIVLGNFEEAGKHLEECDRVRKQFKIKETQANIAATLSNWASYYTQTNKMDKAEVTWTTLNKSLLDFTRDNFYFMTDEEKAQFWKSFNGYFSIFQAFGAQRAKQNPAIVSEMYNVQLSTKAILLSASNKIRKRILSSRDTSMVSMYYQWTRKREQLAQLYSSGSNDAKQRMSIDSLEIAAKLLEKEMNISAEDLSKDKGGETFTWKNVQQSLGPDEAAVEIMRIKHYNRYWRDSLTYAALIVTAETKQYPKLVVLNDGKLLEGRYLKFYRNSIQAQNTDTLSYRQYWGALNEALKGKSRIYLSLDGVYNQINLNTLKDPKGGYLVDDKNLTILSNTKDLVAIKSRKVRRMSLSSATLFGFPTYFLGQKNPVSNTRSAGTRDFDAASVDRTGISPLLGTQEEIKKVGSILQAHKMRADVFTNEMASEHAIKTLQHPRVLHIATHGFFVEESNSELAIASGNEANPLLRAGLLLAGAADFIQNRSRLEEENGILTAYEAANLDLDNTDLVVLSACETGKGEVQNGEGVYGLQRAFQTAGAQTIVMSLWKVDDAATQQLMTSFYTNWMNGMSKAEALKSAQISLKKQYPNPYYWGAFVMLEN